jgi:quercetin dioxygenase-like cupin family protein
MTLIRRVLFVFVCAACFGAGALWAQQSQSGTRREPQFENAHVKVWKSIIMPNQPLALHRHEHGRALIALKGGQLHVVDKDRKPLDTYDWESGKAYWLDADKPGTQHGDLNEGKEPIEVIVVELKNDR